MDMSTRGIFLCSMIVILIETNLAKSVSSTTSSALYDHPYSCNCEISVNNSTTTRMDLGIVKLITLKKSSSSNSIPCHALHHRCHKACEQAADLERKVHDRETLGYTLCMKHEHMTPAGGASLYSHAAIHTPQCTRHKDHLKAMITSKKLCCGHALIPINTDKQVRAFGWNPDCQASKYVFGY